MASCRWLICTAACITYSLNLPCLSADCTQLTVTLLRLAMCASRTAYLASRFDLAKSARSIQDWTAIARASLWLPWPGWPTAVVQPAAMQFAANNGSCYLKQRGMTFYTKMTLHSDCHTALYFFLRSPIFPAESQYWYAAAVFMPPCISGFVYLSTNIHKLDQSVRQLLALHAIS